MGKAVVEFAQITSGNSLWRSVVRWDLLSGEFAAEGLPMTLIRFLSAFRATATALAVTCLVWASSTAEASEPHSVAFLGIHFQNDNEMYEPTSDAERNRMVKIEQMFKVRLIESGQFRFAEIDPELKAKISAGQTPGECGGCEVAYGKELGTEQVAWINVQKVSNLILNMNVYMADVAANKMTFVRSVDIRGNTDESWERSLNFLLKRYLLPDAS